MTDHSYFNYDVFFIDPVKQDTDDTASLYQCFRELEEYEKTTPMTTREKHALWMWTTHGHHVDECPASLYHPGMTEDLPRDFLDVYRLDHKLALKDQNPSAEVKTTCSDRIRFLRPLPSPFKDPDGSKAFACCTRASRYDQMRLHLLILWDYLAGEELYISAREYLREHLEDGVPFPFAPFL